jgi:hypothetical protein
MHSDCNSIQKWLDSFDIGTDILDIARIESNTFQLNKTIVKKSSVNT